MSEDLKKQTTSSILWNAFDKIGFQVIALIIGLITLRLLSPSDFGLIGALAIFTALSNILVESGFTAAMVRRENNTNTEYVAVFLFNIFLSILFYVILYSSAPLIAEYCKMPELVNLSRFLFLTIILNSVGIIQNIILTKRLAFKILSISNMTGGIISGIITIILIYLNFGYWALAWQIMLQVGIKSLMLWIMSSWHPDCKPNFKVIKELFSFSFSLIASSLLNTFVRYIYNPVIARYFGDDKLGYYSEAYKFFYLPHSIISNTFTGVAYPVLSCLNEEENRQVVYLRKMMRMIAFCVFPVLLGAMACFDNLVTVILTEKWLPIIPYFQILAVAGLVIPMHNMYLNLMNVKGHSKKNFIMELLRNSLILLSLLICSKKIEWMLYGFTISTLISYITDLFFVRKIINYKISEQLKDIFPYAVLALCMSVVVYLFGLLPINIYLKTVAQILIGAIIYLCPVYFLGSQVFKDILQNLFHKGKQQL